MSATVQVVMPAFNAAEYIGEAIESVVAQTFTEWELVVVDDGSTDATPRLVEGQSDSRIVLIPIDHSGLPAKARNRALRESGSPFVAFLDADDIWREDKLARQLELMDARPEVGLVHTAVETLEEGELRPLPTQPGLHGPEALFDRLAGWNFVSQSSVLMRRTLLDAHGAFDEDPRLRGNPDYELWLRLAPHTTFAYIDEPLVVYRLTDGQLSKGPELGLGYVTLMEKMHRLYPDLCAQLGTPYLRQLGRRRCLYGLSGRGRRELLAVLRGDPLDGPTWKLLVLSMFPPSHARAIAHRAFSEVLKSKIRDFVYRGDRQPPPRSRRPPR